MLTVNQLSVTYPGASIQSAASKEAVRSVSFGLGAGSTTVLLGPSGSGKSSIGLALAALLPPGTSTSGHVWMQASKEKQDLLRLNSTHPRIAWVAQGAQQALSPTRSIRSLLQESLSFHQVSQKSNHPVFIESLAHDLDLQLALLEAFPHQLSGGQRQRCLIALALCKNPSLLIADEPTTSLDILAAAKLLDLLRSIQEKRQLALLFITHDLRICAQLQAHTLYLREGQILQEGGFEELLGQADSPLNQIRNHWSRIHHIPFPDNPPPLVSLRQVFVSYEARGGMFARKQSVKALNNVSLSLQQGESVGIFGESGSGKSTLGKVMCSLLPYKGDIQWHGDIGMDKPAKRVQLILQDSYSSLHPRFSVRKILKEILRIHQPEKTNQQHQQIAVEFLRSARLDESYLDKFPSTLSGGERQRVAIARSLAIQPSLLILDESVSSLDPEIQHEILTVIVDLARKTEMTLMVISHDYRIIRQLCHRVIVLKDGHNIESFSVADAEHQHQHHPHTKRLLEAQNVPIE